MSSGVRSYLAPQILQQRLWLKPRLISTYGTKFGIGVVPCAEPVAAHERLFAIDSL